MNMILTTAPDRLNEALLLALARARARGESAYLVAARAGVHPSELSRWMNGRRNPNADQSRRVAEALGVEVDDIFPMNESSPRAATLLGETNENSDPAGNRIAVKSVDVDDRHEVYPR
jgi:transcriptional regulator with XRE-family HTH domain